ncbi:hypothetical protein LXL04_022317 [Taraxacum kok-saghyz]
MKVDIISRENIKPSSPTPQHLQTFNLSVLHQLIPSPYAPIILYYPNQDTTNFDVHEQQDQLKISLSQTLTHFYPLAGTIKDDLSIDCDDVGAYYAIARVNTSLIEFLKHLDLDLINRFLPCDPTFSRSSLGNYVTNVQVNVFECGGFAIGLCISHIILDGTAVANFLKCWAALHDTIHSQMLNSKKCKKSKEVIYPNLTTPFNPATNTHLRNSSMAMWGSLIKIGKCNTRRFVFHSSSIAILKAEASKTGIQHPTRVELVSAFLWKCVMAAYTQKRGFENPSLMTHAVNLRKRSAPTLSENTIGNLVWLASSECKTMNNMKLHDLVDQVRGSITEINGEFVGKLQGDDEGVIQVMEESLKGMIDCGRNENVDFIGFTSWCKMGFYDVDFGWGKPIWVCSNVANGGSVFTDFVVMMDTRCGDGIEAWVNMDEQEMSILQHNPELLTLASLDPSPM